MTSSKLLLVLGLTLCLACSLTIAELNIISKAEWEGQDADGELTDLKLPATKVIISHTATETCSNRTSCEAKVRNIQKLQIDGFHFSDIGYNFLVGNDGNVYEGRGWSKVGAHTKNYNAVSIGIAFIGNFNRQTPSDGAIRAAQELIAEGVRLGKLSTDYKLFGHRQFSSTESPGDSLYSIIKKWPHWSRSIR